MPNKTLCPVLCPGGFVRTLCPAVSGVPLVLLAVSGCVRLFAGGALSARQGACPEKLLGPLRC
eukprot:2071543-Alexandrium_andersonii.AAC.1